MCSKCHSDYYLTVDFSDVKLQVLELRHLTVYSVQSIPVFIGPDCRRNNQREREKERETFLFNHDQLKIFKNICFSFLKKYFT